MFLYRKRFLLISIFSLSLAYTQTEWTRYEGNPVLVPDGIEESTTIFDGSVLVIDDLYRIWYSSTAHPEGLYCQTFYAESPDGVTWTKLGDGPVLPRGSGGAWDETSALNAYVLYEDSTFKLWYTGRGAQNFQIGYAESMDGITWEKHTQNPVLSFGAPGELDADAVYGPCVLKYDSLYHMWYTGFLNNTTRIFYAISDDGLSWTRYAGNPVLDIGEPDEFDADDCANARVRLIGDTFHMWYSGYDGSVQTIGYATSSDGLNWSKWPGNPILVVEPDSWEGISLGVSDVHFLADGTVQLWYNAGTPPNRSLGCATSQFAPVIPGDRVLSILRTAWVAGDTVQVPVLLSESYDVAGIDFTLSYDTAILTFDRIDTTSLTADFLIASNEIAPGTLAVAMAAPWSLSISSEAAVATMDFAISADAAVGTSTPIHFLSAALADTSGYALDLSTQDGQVLVTWPGDLNFDGLISSGDAVVTLRICVGAHDPTPQEFAMADRDSNGVVEEIDALCLLQTAVGLGCSVEGGVSQLMVELIRPEISGAQGSEVIVPIQLSLADQLAAGSLELALPPDLVTAIDVTPGDLLAEGYTAWKREEGILRLGFLTANGLPQSDGILLNLHLTLGTDLTTHELDIISNRLFDTRGRTMDLDIVLSTDDGRHPVPGQYSLAPAYPNPFNPATTIRYDLPAAVPVQLLVYDLLGREIIRLVEAAQSTGAYEVHWNGTDAHGRSLTSGIYIARLVTPEYSKSIKLVLLK
jgi:predicted GH43/DUF377 family glycosyl hydrolase